MKNPIKNQLPYFFIAALFFCFTANVNAQQVDKILKQEQTVKKNPDIVQKKKAKKSKVNKERKARKVAKKAKRKAAKKDKVSVHRPGTENPNADTTISKKPKSKTAATAKKGKTAKAHAYGKNKGMKTGKEFGKARSKTARQHKQKIKKETTVE